MDERLRICLWMVGGGGFGSVLGGAFGGLSGALLFARSGYAAGTGLARRVADAFTQTAEREPSPLGRAVLIGAADGVLFLGILGLVAGTLLGMSGRTAVELLLPLVMGSVLLVGGAAFFGMLAYAMSRSARTFGGVISFGLLGAFLAALTLGVNRLLLGVVSGFFVGLLVSRAVRPYSPKFHPPRVAKPSCHPRSHAGTDSTGSPPAQPNDDFFPKPDSFEEL